MPRRSAAPTNPSDIARALERFCAERPRRSAVLNKNGVTRKVRRYFIVDDKSGSRVAVLVLLDGTGCIYEGMTQKRGEALVRRLVKRLHATEAMRAKLLPRAKLLGGLAGAYLSVQDLKTLASIAREREHLSARDIEGQQPEDVAGVMAGDGRRIGRLVHEILCLRAENGRLKTARSKRP